MAEYWNYLDRPETFISIGDSDEPLGRMLGTLRFWFSKDLVRLLIHGGGVEWDGMIKADQDTEIRQRQTMQAVQLHTGRILPGTYLPLPNPPIPQSLNPSIT